jgi:purine-binding chemotaxis protein CheW
MNQIIIFSINSKRYCFNINEVNEIVDNTESSKIPESADYIEGIINFRDNVLILLNLKKLLKNDTTKYTEYSKIIILNSNESKIGILVDDVEEMLKIEKESIKVLKPTEKIDSKYIYGHVKNEKETILHLDLKLIIKDTKIFQMNL